MNTLLEYIEKGLKDLESAKFRSFMLLILAILGDNYYNIQCVERILNILDNALRHNASYFFETDMLTQWIHTVNMF